ncbi:MAG: tetratricopeptide repeat protein [Spirochaetales bacterium]|nr:tetratricopeptide repeat protein [Spirochaetales bacterium]
MDARSKGAAAIARATDEYRAGEYEAALATLASATVDEEDYLDLAYLLGLCYSRLERFDEALLYLEQVVTQGDNGPRIFQCRMSLAYIYAATGRSKLAEYELEKLVEASRVSTQVCAALGHANWKQGKLDEGLSWYRKALELDAENPTALNGYGYLLACAGKELDVALTHCRKALDADPHNPAYADSLGWACFKLGRLDEAARYLYAAAAELGDEAESRSHVEALEKAVRQS